MGPLIRCISQMIWWIEQIHWMIFVYWEWWISIEVTKICYFGLALSGIGSQPTRLSCFKLKKLKNYMGYQVDFLLPLKLQKISYYFGLCWKMLLANQFVGFFTFDLFDLLTLVPGVHCYIVLFSFLTKLSLSYLFQSFPSPTSYMTFLKTHFFSQL